MLRKDVHVYPHLVGWLAGSLWSLLYYHLGICKLIMFSLRLVKQVWDILSLKAARLFSTVLAAQTGKPKVGRGNVMWISFSPKDSPSCRLLGPYALQIQLVLV